MYDPDKFRSKAVRSQPSQARSKERVRIILAAALALYQERGIEDVTTNDIAARAHIPIGSLYRYYPNKNAITAALTELYTEDVIRVFDMIRNYPLLEMLSWEEVLLLLTDGWTNYDRMNGSFEFLYAERISPALRQLTQPLWERFIGAFVEVLMKRCPLLEPDQTLVCFRLCYAAADMATDTSPAGSPDAYRDIVGAAAAYMFNICPSAEHHNAHEVLA